MIEYNTIVKLKNTGSPELDGIDGRVVGIATVQYPVCYIVQLNDVRSSKDTILGDFKYSSIVALETWLEII